MREKMDPKQSRSCRTFGDSGAGTIGESAGVDPAEPDLTLDISAAILACRRGLVVVVVVAMSSDRKHQSASNQHPTTWALLAHIAHHTACGAV